MAPTKTAEHCFCLPFLVTFWANKKYKRKKLLLINKANAQSLRHKQEASRCACCTTHTVFIKIIPINHESDKLPETKNVDFQMAC